MMFQAQNIMVVITPGSWSLLIVLKANPLLVVKYQANTFLFTGKCSTVFFFFFCEKKTKGNILKAYSLNTGLL